MKRVNSGNGVLLVMHEHSEGQDRPAKLARAREPPTAPGQQQRNSQQSPRTTAHCTSSSRGALLEMLQLLQTVNAVRVAAAAGGSTQPVALPATLADANTSLTMCSRALSLATALLHANTADSQLTDKALRVAEAALAATCQQLGQAKQLAITMQQQRQLHIPEAAAAGAAGYEDDALADTCSSCILQLPCIP